jgi:uncharacterized protein (TIGR03663 family)
MRTRGRWISAGILVLAFVLRVAFLGLKPAHFDEGVNGWFVDGITRQGFYHYDPTNFHGPLHFYVLFLSQTLLGRAEWVLRLPIALVSTASVAMVLAYSRFFDRRICQIAAGAMAISPGMVFYGRYAIHESWMVLFLLITAWGLAGLWRFCTRAHLWAAGLGFTGMILTKETYVIHAVALLMAVPCMLFYEKYSRSTHFAFGGWKFPRRELGKVALVCSALVVFFYSGALMDWPGPQRFDDAGNAIPRGSLAGLWECFGPWIHTGSGAAQSGHEKPWHYWLQLLAGIRIDDSAERASVTTSLSNEWPAAIGLLASVALLAPRSNRLARYLAIYGVGALTGYSIISYKTPWCVISLVWPFYFVFGFAVLRAAQKLDAWTAATLGSVLGIFTLFGTLELNFRHFADETEPYVYVQTRDDINKLLVPLRMLAARDERNFFITGHILAPEQHPLLWLLADFPRIDFPALDQVPDPVDADVLLVDDTLTDSVEPNLHFNYFREPLKMRGQAEESATLYLRQGTFGALFPRRVPEFQPGAETSDEVK